MTWLHKRLCASDAWLRAVAKNLLPWALAGVDLGDEVLEMGPGPGAATDQLSRRVRRLTCVEIDSTLAAALASRVADRNVRVLCGDATSLPTSEEAFDSVLCLSMLHHVPSAALQDRLFRNAARALRSGGVFVAVDILPTFAMRLLHLGDVMVPVDPRALPPRLAAAGFAEVDVAVKSRAFRVHARL